MHCVACAKTVERALCSVEGVSKAEVQYATSTAVVHVESATDHETLLSAVKKTGYSANPKTETPIQDSSDHRRLALKCGISILLSLPLLASMLFELGGLRVSWLINPFVQWALATPVQFFIGFEFYRHTFQSLRQKSLGMDALVMSGTTAAYGYSLYNVFHGGALYFETSVVVITLVLLGRYLETRARERTSSAIQRLLTLRPATAILVTDEGDKEIPVHQLKKGDVIRVRPGDRVPADGTVLSGSAEFDESAFTGESVPVLKEAGATVSEGTMCGDGTITFSATSLGEKTMLARVVQAVNQAQNSKPPVRKLVDTISGIFTPIVLGISVLTFFGWFFFTGDIESALQAAVAVLLISCPCALGLATPIAVVAGIGRGADIGVLFRNGLVLEQSGKVSMMAFDKTNTLTKGSFSVERLISEVDEEKLKYVAAAAEKGSEHPIARGIASLDATAPAAEKFSSYPGRGVIARVDGQEVLVGNLRFAQEKGIQVGAQCRKMEEEGLTAMVVVVDQNIWGYIGVADSLRDEAAEVCAALHRQHIRLCLISGDAESVVQKISASLGIDRWWAQVLPGGKQEIVESLRKDGHTVAMVGDGINDAPALAAADLGIAMGEGSDVAIESADIALVGNRLTALPRLVRLSRKTMSVIHQNLFWAFGYNVLGIPLAMMGLLNPMIAGAAMACSSLSVVLNSLRLQKVK